MPITPRRGRTALLGGACFLILAVVTGCAASPGDPTPTESPTEAPVAAELVPGGSAEENLPFFDATNRRSLEAAPAGGGRAMIDGLVAAGFPRENMELTADKTAIGLDAEAVEFSVLTRDGCLLGQIGGSVGDYASSIQPTLGTGRCLIGQTRPIDW